MNTITKDIFNHITSFLIPYQFIGLIISNKSIYKNCNYKFYAGDYHEANISCCLCNYLFAWYTNIIYHSIECIDSSSNGKYTRITNDYICNHCIDNYIEDNPKAFIFEDYPQITDNYWYSTIINN